MLMNCPMTVTQISKKIREKPLDIADDLAHLLQSLKHSEYVAEITPATCRKCGFEFRSDKLSKPSKCPECHSTWLQEAKVEIRSKASDAGGEGNDDHDS